MKHAKDLLDIIDRDMPLIIDLVKDINEHSELGYKERRGIISDMTEMYILFPLMKKAEIFLYTKRIISALPSLIMY